MTVRELRERTGLSQAELAAAAGCEQTTISQLELGKVRDPRYSTIAAVARALRVSVDELAAAIERTVAA